MADDTTQVTPPAPAPAPAAAATPPAPAPVEAKAKKAPSKLNIAECIAELDEMKDDVEFDRKWDETTPLADLRALVKEGRAVLAEGDEAIKIVDQAMLDANPILVEHGIKIGDPVKLATETLSKHLDAKVAAEKAAAEKAAAEGGAPKEGSIGDANADAGAQEGGRTVRDVFAVSREDVIVRLQDGTRRLYSEKSHGEHWQTLAKQYAQSQHGVFE